MKKNFIPTLFLILMSFSLIFHAEARPGGGGGRAGGGGGGRAGGGGGGHASGGRSVQRSPSMSRSVPSNTRQAARPTTRQTSAGQATRVNTTNSRVSGNARVGENTQARAQVQQYIKSNPAVRSNTTNVGGGNVTRANVGRDNTTRVDVNRGNVSQQVRNAVNNNQNIGRNVRNNVNSNHPNRNNWFNNNFFDRQGFSPSYYNHQGNWWGAATATGIGSWLGWESSPYYYGYTDGYFEPVPYSESVVEGPKSSQNIAYDNSTAGDWMSLGVFAVTKSNESAATSNLFLQLALNKDGEIAGTLYNATTDKSYEMSGEVDSESQRAVWKMAGNSGSPIIETGVYNLAHNEVPIRVHFSNGVIQDKILVRIDATGTS